MKTSTCLLLSGMLLASVPCLAKDVIVRFKSTPDIKLLNALGETEPVVDALGIYKVRPLSPFSVDVLLSNLQKKKT